MGTSRLSSLSVGLETLLLMTIGFCWSIDGAVTNRGEIVSLLPWLLATFMGDLIILAGEVFMVVNLN